MPHGQWVAFENDEVHDCKKPPKVEVARPTPRKSAQVDAPTEFDDIVIPDHAAPQPAPVARPVPQKRPTPPAPAPVTPRPSAGLTHLPPHPATTIDKSAPDRRNLQNRGPPHLRSWKRSITSQRRVQR